MVTIRKSAPKSKNGCQTCKIRHVKCDEARPHCQRCITTGRSCDAYNEEGKAESPEVTLYVNALATRTRNFPPSEVIQERRSFDFFRNKTVPCVTGFFGASTWNLVLQACNKEPVVGQAAVALGALHERVSMHEHIHNSKEIETNFPIRQYAKALGDLRQYLSTSKGLDIDIILTCALIHISIEAIQNNYENALVHLENSLHLLQRSAKRGSSSNSTSNGLFKGGVDTDICRAFLRLDLHASAFQAMRPPSMAEISTEVNIPGRFSSLVQAKDVLDEITGHFYFFNHTVAQEYKYRKQEDIPFHAAVEATLIKARFDTWNDRFEKFLHKSTSRFSRQDQLVIDVLVINHRIHSIDAATCIAPEAMVFDQFDAEFDEIVTLAANVIRSRKSTNTVDFQLDMGIIGPLYNTAIMCREPWIRQRAMSLLRSVKFREGVWEPAAQAVIAQAAIDRENSFMDPNDTSERPMEFARVHSVGTDSWDPVKRVAEVNLTQKLNGLDGPWYDHVVWCSW